MWIAPGRKTFARAGAWMAGAIIAGTALRAADQPQWGAYHSRNMVSSETGLPDRFNPETGLNVKWSAALGSESHGSPIVANGRVYQGTNNDEPRDPKHQGDRGVLMCFQETTGELLWQLVVPKREEDPYFDWPKCGVASTATVEGDRVYIVSNRGEVMCLDSRGLANGNDGPYQDEGRHMTPPGQTPLMPDALDADILWLFDLTREAGIWSHDAAHSSILIDGPYLYVNTSTGVDNTHKRIRTPEAPSLVVLDKATGRYLARDEERIGPNIFHCTWSSPSLGVVGGRRLVFFAGGDGVLYAFEALDEAPGSAEPAALKRVWKYDCDPTAPKTEVHRYNLNRREGPSNIYGMPVFVDGRIYVAGGGDLFWGKVDAWMQCVDANGEGDVTSRGPIWRVPLERHTISTPAVSGDRVYIADAGRLLHCVDAATGRSIWRQETKGEIWASPLVADEKVYLGTRRGDFWILSDSNEKTVLTEVDLGSPISGTATAANGVVYVATMTRLFAFASESGWPERRGRP